MEVGVTYDSMVYITIYIMLWDHHAPTPSQDDSLHGGGYGNRRSCKFIICPICGRGAIRGAGGARSFRSAVVYILKVKRLWPAVTSSLF